MYPEIFAADDEATANEGSEVWVERLKEHASSQSGFISLASYNGIPIGVTRVGRGHWPKTHHLGTFWDVYVKRE